MDKYLICFLLIFFLPNIFAATVTSWDNFPFAYPCQEGLCVPKDRYNCPCWHTQYACKPDNRFGCCEDPDFFPMPGGDKFTCSNQTKTVIPPKKNLGKKMG